MTARAFGPSPKQLDMFARKIRQAAKNHSPEVERLIPVAQSLAKSAGPDGITVADLREEAVRLEILTGKEAGRQLSYLGAVMKAAKLLPTNEWRRSHIDQSNGNLHKVWRA